MEENEERAADSGNQQHESNEHENPGLSSAADTADPNGQRKDNEQPAKRNWKSPYFWDFKFSTIAQAVFSVALIFVGVAQVCIYLKQAGIMGGQQTLMQGQLDQMVAQQRPWISAKVEIVRPVEFYEWNSQKGISVTLHFSLNNRGSSPATNVNIGGHIWEHPGNTHADILTADQNVICDKTEKIATESKMTGPTMYPGDIKPKDIGFGTSGIYRSGEPILFSIQGCIDYTYNGDRHGRTGFRMLLGSEQNNRWVGVPFYIPLEPPSTPGAPRIRDVSIGEFKFAEDGTGGNYAK